MKFDEIKNPNYVATIIQVPALEKLDGLDNLRALRMFGMQALVSKDVEIGDVGILFSTEVQLSEEYARENNLYRHNTLNSDPTQTGYLEDNRRVKAIKLRGHRSDSIFMPLESLGYLKVNPGDMSVGDVFDSIGGHEICRKYVIKEPQEYKGPVARVRKVDAKAFPVHFDTPNGWRESDKIPSGAEVVITQKLHGTSIRLGRVPVVRDLKWYEKLATRLGIKVQTHETKFVVGSRMVVKSLDGDTEVGKEHYYAADEWTKYAYDHGLDKIVPEGFLVYGELVGFTSDGKPIQKGYTYENRTQFNADDSTLYVYRVATITSGGIVNDFSWPQVKRWCKDNGLNWVPEIKTVRMSEFDPEPYMDANYYNDFSDNEPGSFVDVPLRLSNPGTVDEGVCARYEGPNGPYILKWKAPEFLGWESKTLDTGEADLESEESR